ncbi:hypothetical protein ACS0TY_007827 [Phlomoides rotata]
MITRQKGGKLEPLNLEIEATTRRNRGQNRREQLRRRQVGIEEMAEDNLVDPMIDRALGGMKMKRMNEKLKKGVGKRCQMLKRDTFHLNMLKEVEDLNKESTIKGLIGMHKVSSLSTQQARETLPPLVNVDPNVKMSQSLPKMEDVKYMGEHNGQEGGWYGQGKQFQQQGPSQHQVQYNTQGPSHNQGQGWFQNTSQQFPRGGSSYNPNVRKHENFSYSNPKAAVQFPSRFNLGAKLPTHEGKPTNEDALTLILKKMEGIEEIGRQ